MRRIETPAPPGIDAALALIAGDITESPFHANVAEARAQVLDYYPCGPTGSGSEGSASEGSGSEGGTSLALTGRATAPLAAVGGMVIVAGALVLRARRRIAMTEAA